MKLCFFTWNNVTLEIGIGYVEGAVLISFGSNLGTKLKIFLGNSVYNSFSYNTIFIQITHLE